MQFLIVQYNLCSIVQPIMLRLWKFCIRKFHRTLLFLNPLWLSNYRILFFDQSADSSYGSDLPDLSLVSWWRKDPLLCLSSSMLLFLYLELLPLSMFCFPVDFFPFPQFFSNSSLAYTLSLLLPSGVHVKAVLIYFHACNTCQSISIACFLLFH